jgi:hypothetical protein
MIYYYLADIPNRESHWWQSWRTHSWIYISGEFKKPLNKSRVPRMVDGREPDKRCSVRKSINCKNITKKSEIILQSINHSFLAPTAPPVNVLGNISSPIPARSDKEPPIKRINTIVDPAKRTKGLNEKSVSNSPSNHNF